MLFYLLFYFVIITLFLYLWYSVYLKSKWECYWKYFFVSSFASSSWFLIYILSYTTTYDSSILLIYSRILFALSIISIYSMLLFFYFFQKVKSKTNNLSFHIIIWFVFFLILWFSIFTPYVISDMVYDSNNLSYLEVYWNYYLLYTVLYFAFLPIFWTFFYFKIKKINNINKIRLKYIFWWFLSFVLLSIIFLTVLPLMWIIIFQKEIIILTLPFLFSVWYSIYRYHFLNTKIIIWKIIIYIISILLSIIWVFLIINLFNYYISVLDNWVLKFWLQLDHIDKNNLIIYFLLLIVFFNIIYKYIFNRFIWYTDDYIFSKKLSNLAWKISFIMNLFDLNIFLKNEFDALFKINYVNIKLFDKNDEELEIYKYFNKNYSRDLFINDIVFIEENKHKFNIELLKHQINEKSYLIFPLINNKRELIWIFKLWFKPFKDQYYTEEIDIIKNFVWYIIWHLKYLEIYSDINDLNINLDKKVDEKTIEYNTLLSKQREFISMSSHEIKTPVANSIFQIDCLIDDFKEWKFDNKYFEKQLDILNEQLLKLWNLVNKIFTVEEYDIKEIKLFIEKINLYILINAEIERFRNVNKKIKINLSIDKDIWYIEIDKVQFTQVIDNLLNNALKFSNKYDSIINIKCYSKWNDIIIKIEDNWKWFNDIDIKSIFWKYVTWWLSTVWIWLGLYLCKKIISMHNWTIVAKNSKELWWASFVIKIPRKYNL